MKVGRFLMCYIKNLPTKFARLGRGYPQEYFNKALATRLTSAYNMRSNFESPRFPDIPLNIVLKRFLT